MAVYTCTTPEYCLVLPLAISFTSVAFFSILGTILCRFFPALAAISTPYCKRFTISGAATLLRSANFRKKEIAASRLKLEFKIKSQTLVISLASFLSWSAN